MKYFEKTAVGPLRIYKYIGKEESGTYTSGRGFKIDPAMEGKLSEKQLRVRDTVLKNGIIQVDPKPLRHQRKYYIEDYKKKWPEKSKAELKEMFANAEKENFKKSKQHEILHYIREKKQKRSALLYEKSLFSRIAEETAAYSRVEGSKLTGFKMGLQHQIPFLRKVLK